VDHPHRQFVARGLAGEWIDESGQDDCRSVTVHRCAACLGSRRGGEAPPPLGQQPPPQVEQELRCHM